MHIGAFDDIGEVGFQFHQLTRAVDDKHTTVIIEEQRAVVEVTHTRHDGPRPLSLLGRKDISVTHLALLVGSQQRIELTVMILQRGSPLAAAIDRSLLQVILRRVRQLIEDIAHRLPVLQILRSHHWSTRHQVHRSRHQIERIAHANNVGIRHISPKHRVLDRLRMKRRVILRYALCQRE